MAGAFQSDFVQNNAFQLEAIQKAVGGALTESDLVATHTSYVGDLDNNARVYYHATNPASAADRALFLS